MITLNGYSKDKGLIPDGIVITWGKDLIAEKGGLLSFIRFFEQNMQNDDSIWLQKCKNKPKIQEDLRYVYIVVCNQVKYRCYYGGYETGEREIYNGDGISWSSRSIITWPRIICAGPIEKAPHKIRLKGFQGFRYCTKLF